MLPPCVGSEPSSPSRLSDLPSCVSKARKVNNLHNLNLDIKLELHRFFIDVYI